MARLSLSYVARGSRGAMFSQWRASAGGAEQYTRRWSRTPARTPARSARSWRSARS